MNLVWRTDDDVVHIEPTPIRYNILKTVCGIPYAGWNRDEGVSDAPKNVCPDCESEWAFRTSLRKQ